MKKRYLYIKLLLLVCLLSAVFALAVACDEPSELTDGHADDPTEQEDSDSPEESEGEEPATYRIGYENLEGASNPNRSTFLADEAAFALSDLTPSSLWYTFAGWYRDEALTERCTAIDPAKESGNLTLWAKWELASYTLSFYANGALVHAETFHMNSELPSAPACPTPAGYTGTWPTFTLSPEDLSVTAVYTPIPYTITYENLLGGTADSPIAYTTAEQTALGTAERTGYRFLGWFDTNGQKVEHIEKGSIGDVTLNAKWELATYRIKYIYDKGIISFSPKLSYTMLDESFMLEQAHANGFTFLGWFDADGQRIEHVEKGSTGDLTLTARWEAIVYPIAYKDTKGADLSGFKTTYTMLDEAYTLPEISAPGYRFLGWFDADGFPITCIEQGDEVFLPIGSDTITLEARWEIVKYTITYTNEKGASTSAFKATYTILDEDYALPAIYSLGYRFLGWSDESGQIVDCIAQGSAGDRTLRAEWEAIVYNLIYSDDKGTKDVPGYDFHYTYTLDETYVLPVIEADGYLFLGWYLKSNDRRIECLEAGDSSVVQYGYPNIPLTAKWQPITYTITYKNTMGADLSDFKTGYTIEDATYTLPVISVEGGVFNGWLLDGKRVSEIPKGTYGNLEITADITPFSYQLVLESAYGDIEEKTHTVYFGTPYTLPVPTAEGKVFLGWFENVSETAAAYTDGNGNSLLPYHKATSRVLYARFAAKQCTVTYDTDGGNTIPAVTVDFGSTFDDSILPVKQGAIFGGWYFAGTSTKYTDATIIHGDVTVKAKWITAKAIATAADFKAIASDPGAGYYLVNDINLGGTVWSPIGTFSGFLDGNGYCVKNFSVSATSTATAFGFFCNNTGTIQNLAFEDFTFNVNAAQEKDINLGVMVGYNSGRIYNCVLRSGAVKIVYNRHLTGDMRIGGMVGRNDGTISGCKNLVSIDSTQMGEYTGSGGMSSDDEYSYSKFGGLVGHNYGLIENSIVQATLTYSSSSSGHRKAHLHVHNHIGGLVGEQAENGRILNCYTNVTLTARTTNIYPSNDDHKEYSNSYLQVGGLIGQNKGTVSGSYSLGTVTGGYANAVYVGGFAGTNAKGGKISNCYSEASASCTVSASIGGFVGENSATIQNSFSAGFAEGFGYIGGFTGRNEPSGTISKCYSTASVKAASGSGAFFAGLQSGTVLKCYFMNGAMLMVGGTYLSREAENGTILRIDPDELWSETFLKQTLYWDDEGWIILHGEDPILEWELAVDHDYELTVVEAGCDSVGYTVYLCRDCNRFFVRDIVAPHGHEKTNFVTVPPTCTTQGYNSYYCHRCEASIFEDIVEPTGHTKSTLLDHLDPDCEHAGYDIYTCEACHIEGGVRYVIAATGHAPESIDATPATCEKAGKTEEIFCSVCGDVLKESTVIPPHSFELTVLTPADCESDGLCTKVCSVCSYKEENVTVPAYGHADINADYRCDRCGILSGSYDERDVIEITSVAELKAIIKDMNGVYRLAADLTLPADWGCIGSLQNPFTGYFDGNGHTLTFTESSSVTTRGLFACNEGIITALRVVGCSVGVSSESCTFGFVAVQNAGYITDCHLSGDFTVMATTLLISSKYETVQRDTYFVFGGIVGTNTVKGTVNGCSTDATITLHLGNKAGCEADWSFFDLVRKGSYKNTRVTSTLTVTFGAIAGENAGLLETCETSGKIHCVGFLPEATVAERYGYAYAATTFHCGDIAGADLGEVRDCSMSGALTFRSCGSSDFGEGKTGKLFGSAYDYTLFRNGKIVF